MCKVIAAIEENFIIIGERRLASHGKEREYFQSENHHDANGRKNQEAEMESGG